MQNYDVVIVGAGSVGLPTACFLAREKVKVLVIDDRPSHGQGQNKTAIGGVRATHSDPAKIQTCKLSLEVFGTWQDRYGDDMHFQRGGYCFPVYEEEHEKALKDLLVIQKQHGLNIDWVDEAGIRHMLPGINPEGLIGGTFSPEDGNLSPILAARAFFRQACEFGVKFRFGETVTGIEHGGGGVRVKTGKAAYSCGKMINAAGARAREIGDMMGVDLPIAPDSHEGGVTEPVEPFFKPLVVDIREFPGSKNVYFYQEQLGHLVFCLTPEPIIPGTSRKSTSAFLPLVARRMMNLFPRLRNLRVRRIWRGLYPMTPDGVPIVDSLEDRDGLYVAAGFCGQGLMLGPGIALNLVSLITTGKPLLPEEIFKSYSLNRDFNRASETLK
ncbi:MAG: FAD-binding oxidoreductase [bacterium]|jgi:sarcosine oxidase subunit beta